MGKSKGAPKAEERPQSVPSAPPTADDDQSGPHSSATLSPQSPVNHQHAPPPHYGATEPPPAFQPQLQNPGQQQLQHQQPESSQLPPPPSYNEAMACPAPPYALPKPPAGPQGGQPIYPPPISGTGYMLQAPGECYGSCFSSLGPAGACYGHLLAH